MYFLESAAHVLFSRRLSLLLTSSSIYLFLICLIQNYYFLATCISSLLESALACYCLKTSLTCTPISFTSFITVIDILEHDASSFWIFLPKFGSTHSLHQLYIFYILPVWIQGSLNFVWVYLRRGFSWNEASRVHLVKIVILLDCERRHARISSDTWILVSGVWYRWKIFFESSINSLCKLFS